MTVLRYVLLGVALVFVAFRLRQRLRPRTRGTPSTAPPRRAPLKAMAWHPRNEVALVAAREVRERTRGRAFRIGTAVILLAIAAAVVIPVLRRGHHSHEVIGVVGTVSAPIRAAAVAIGPAVGTTVTLRDEPSQDAATRDLDDGTVNLVLDGTSRVIVKTAPSGSDTSTTGLLARALAATVSLQAGLEASGVPPARAAQLAHAPPLPINGLHPPKRNDTARTSTLYGLILTYVLLTQYGTWILMGVVEEKSSRVIEILLAALRPVQLLTGKVIGIGVVALGQAALIVGVALGLGAAVGSDLLHGSAALGIVDLLLWLVLGYAFYCWVYAAVGSLGTRQEHLQTLAFPVQLPLLVGYIASLTSLGSTSPSAFVKVLAYLPPTAPFGMPVLVADNAVSWWQVVLSALLTAAATVAVARGAAAVYLRAILRTGQRVKLREVISRRRQQGSPERVA